MKKQTAEERMRQLFEGMTKDIPELANKYIHHLSSRYGFCGEIMLTAFAHYAQAVEKLKCTDQLYKIDKEGKVWFKEHGR